MKEKLGTKRDEYASDVSVFSNFDAAQRIRNRTREAIAFDYALKHLVSIIDIIDSVENKTKSFSDELILEKFTDFANYLVLIYAMMQESNKRSEKGG